MDNILISSTEELSPEDRLLLASSKRQEPQGEEHATSSDTSHKLTRTKQALSSDSDSSSDEEEDEEEDGVVYQNVQGMLSGGCGGSNSNSLGSSHGHRRGSASNPCNLSLDSNSHSSYNTLIIHQNNASLLADTWIPASHEFTSLATGSNRNSTCSNPRKSTSPIRDYESHLGLGSHELSDIPRDYLNQLTVLKHLAKEVQKDPMSEPPSSKLLRSASFSRSQPDLSQSLSTPLSSVPVPPASSSASHSYYNYYGPSGGGGGPCLQPSYPSYPSQLLYSPPGNGSRQNQSYGGPKEDDGGACVVPSTSVQMLEILMRENSNLRAELANARMRIQTIHKLEAELTKLQRQHSALFESAERRESLERTARVKLSTELSKRSMEVKRLTAVNRELLSSSNSLQNLSSYSSLGSDVDVYKKELSKKDNTIAQLVSQSKDLKAEKERQEVELAAQRATLEEQRTHIDILDSALTTAQGNVVRLEEECRRNQDYAEKVQQLQRALTSLQLYNEKREQSEKKLRSQLESDITDLKLQLASKNAKSNTRANNNNGASTPSTKNYTATAPPPYPGTSSNTPSSSAPNSASNSNQNLHQAASRTDITPELQVLQEKLRLSEDQILSLTSVVQRWENFFSLPLDKEEAKGVSNVTPAGTTPSTPNSWTRGGTPHFNFATNGGGSAASSTTALDNASDLPNTVNRAVELEWKIKDLECRLVEKDNMLRALNPYTPSYNNNNSTPSSYVPTTGFRESPSFTPSQQGYQHQHQKSSSNCNNNQNINHQPSISLASMMDRRYIGMGLDPMQFYEKVGKCESEPPSYANLPPKLRLGGSGSSLAKNSNESLGSAAGGNGGVNSSNPAVSEPDSVSSGENVKSIDEQLKELNTQLLSKGGCGGGPAVSALKMQSSGLCCIPGFPHQSSTARKGKIPQPLLEGMMMMNKGGGGGSSDPNDAANSFTMLNQRRPSPPLNSNNNPNVVLIGVKASSPSPPVLPPLPRPPQHQHQYHHHHPHHQYPSSSSRTSSGPPFDMSNDMSPTALCGSVDSVLTTTTTAVAVGPPASGPNVFSPVTVVMPKGLPPKGPGLEGGCSGKCRSLERDQKSKSSNEGGGSNSSGGGKLFSDRCKSLDRRELKKEKEEKEKDKGAKQDKGKSGGVTSKAAFFGGLLSRRSPSPSRKNKNKDAEKGASPAPSTSSSVPPSKGKFSFARSLTPSGPRTPKPSHQPPESATESSDVEIDTEFLDHQGRSSQSQRSLRMSNKWSPSSEETVPPSPWVQRRSGGDVTTTTSTSSKGTRKASLESLINTSDNTNEGVESSSGGKTTKWGKIVKSPFGLRYTFGGPK